MMSSTIPKTNLNFRVTFDLLSANAFNLDKSIILSVVKELTLSTTLREEESFENIVGKGKKMLVTSIFSFSQNIFNPSKTEIFTLVTPFLSSAHASNLAESQILSFGKDLTLYHTILTFNDPEEKGF